MGVRPCKFGNANVVCPLPPKVVPSSENSAWLWLIGGSCPLHSAHRLGSYPKDMIRISERNGSAIASSSFVALLAGGGCASGEAATRRRVERAT
jgi:hypothetical protein